MEVDVQLETGRAVRRLVRDLYIRQPNAILIIKVPLHGSL